MPVELTAIEAEMIRQFAKIVDDSVEAHTRETRETMKKLEPLVQKHELILGENEASGARGEIGRHRERLHELEHFRTEWKAKVGTIATVVTIVISVIVWLIEKLITKI